MALLELVAPAPDWTTALGRALERPAGIPERRAQRPAGSAPEQRRRLSDDLAWLREAVEDPAANGLREVPDTAAVALWRTDVGAEPGSRLLRLRDRGVLDAAGFLLHESGAA